LFSSRRRHTIFSRDWSSDVCSSDLLAAGERLYPLLAAIATLDASDRVLRSVGPGKADLAWEVTLRDGTRVRVLEQVTSEEDVGQIGRASCSSNRWIGRAAVAVRLGA